MDGFAQSLELRRLFLNKIWSLCSVFPPLEAVRTECVVGGGWYHETKSDHVFPITKSERDIDKKNNPGLTHMFVAAGTGIDSFTDLHRFFGEENSSSKFSPYLVNNFQYLVKKKRTKKQWYEKFQAFEDQSSTNVFDSLLNEGAYIYLAGDKEMVTPAEKALKKLAEKKGLELEKVTRAGY